jgi:hypothetical protein
VKDKVAGALFCLLFAAVFGGAGAFAVRAAFAIPFLAVSFG